MLINSCTRRHIPCSPIPCLNLYDFAACESYESMTFPAKYPIYSLSLCHISSDAYMLGFLSARSSSGEFELTASRFQPGKYLSIWDIRNPGLSPNSFIYSKGTTKERGTFAPTLSIYTVLSNRFLALFPNVPLDGNTHCPLS